MRFKIIILAILYIMVLVTVSVNSRPTEETSLLEKALLEMIAPLQKCLVIAAQGVEGLWREYFYLVGVREENQSLKKTVGLMRGQLHSLREAGMANERLTKLLNLKTELSFPLLGAQVVAWDPSPWLKTITIDRGRKDGVNPGMPVVLHEGVVGRVVEVSANYAKVLLVIDYNSSVDALIQRTRVRGVMIGRSEKTCGLMYVVKNEDVKKGDVVITSGMAGVFPRGYPLGTIKTVRKISHDIFYEIDVAPAVNFNRLEEVIVVLTVPPPF